MASYALPVRGVSSRGPWEGQLAVPTTPSAQMSSYLSSQAVGDFMFWSLQNPYVEAPTPTVMAFGDMTFGRQLGVDEVMRAGPMMRTVIVRTDTER